MLKAESPIPQAVLERVPRPRSLVLNHHVSVSAQRWRRLLSSLELPPPGPLLAQGDRVEISRADVLHAGDAPITGDNAVQLFYYTLAWGLGLKAQLVTQRLDALQRNLDTAPQILTRAWIAVREGGSPQECYEVVLHPSGQTRLPFFGPAFATKFLYFAQGISTPPRNLILDQVVASTLGSYGQAVRMTGLSSVTYHSYCAMLLRWAQEARTALDEHIEPDQVEKALFVRETPM